MTQRTTSDHSHAAAPDHARAPRVRVEAMSDLPTRFGDFRIYVFSAEGETREHVAMVRGDVWGATNVLTRLHSECLTGDIMSSLRCDCREQLERGLEVVGAANQGIVLYLRQEGRGIGLANKIRAYKLQQEQGLDTVDANLALGFPDDLRDYGVAAALLRTLGVRSVDLLTNNPAKVLGLQRHGMAVTSRVPHAIAPGEHNEAYLATKAMRSGHLLPLPAPRAATRTP